MSDLEWRVRNWITYIDEFLESYHHGELNFCILFQMLSMKSEIRIALHKPF